jgi:hypothetical protein
MIGKNKKIDDKYKWYDYLYYFIDKLNMTENEIYKMNYIHGLNWLSYFKNLDDFKDKHKI